jgi:UDP-glucuronate 4-epimerase
MKILLTGSAGFIGFHLAKALLLQGYEVFSLDNVNDYYHPDLKYARLAALGFDRKAVDSCQVQISTVTDRHRFLKLDLCQREAMTAFFQSYSFDAIVHLAAQAGVRYSLKNPWAYAQDNVFAFTNILEGARTQGVQHLVYASSSSVYGLNQKTPFATTDGTNHPVSLYAATKKSNELMAHSYSHLYQIPTTGLRFFTVYGPWGRPDMAPMIFLRALHTQTSIELFNHGDMWRDFTYIDTVVEGCCRVLTTPPQATTTWDGHIAAPNQSSAPYAIYNIGGESTVKLLDFVSTLESVTGIAAHKILKPMPLGDVQMTAADMTDFTKKFGALPVVKLEHGLQQLAQWYRDYACLHHV